MRQTHIVTNPDKRNMANRVMVILSMMMVVLTIALSDTAVAFWEMPQVIEEIPDQAWNLQADVTCRINDYNVLTADKGLQKPGVDGWISYIAYDDVGISKVHVKKYTFNNKYPRDDSWNSNLQLPELPSHPGWGQSIDGFYFRQAMDASHGIPAAYLSYITNLNVAGNAVSFNIVILSDTGESQVFHSIEINPAAALDDFSKTQIVSAGNVVVLLWDEVDIQTGLRSIKATKLTIKWNNLVFICEAGPVVSLASNIDAPQGLDYRAIMFSYIHQGDYRGAVCWRTQSSGGLDEIRAKGFRLTRSGNDLTLSAASYSIPLSVNPNGDALTRIRMVTSPCPRDNNTDTVITASWHCDPVDPGNSVVKLLTMDFDAQQIGWLVPADTPHEVPVTDASPLYAIAADNGFMRPQNMAYDPVTGQLAIAPMANHRIHILEDPASSTPGVWISELYNGNSDNSGSVTRLADADTQIRQIGWLALPEVSGGYSNMQFKGFSFPKTRADSLVPVRNETWTNVFVGNLHELEMVSDNFSSLFCFYLSSDMNGYKISWVCDGLLIRNDGARDRFTFPYDLEFVPPVWTPTPTETPAQTPTGPPPTQPPTWTPRPDGLWVADMAGHRIVRLNMRGEIMATTHTEAVTPEPTWSEYEHFDVISPNDVSAAYDGSCWAIDWGRNRVVKIAPDGTMTAFTEPCESLDPDLCQDELIHPLAIDCAGDPNSCFVADYEGNRVFKLILSGGTITAQASSAQYYRPKAISVSREYRDDDLYEMVWVADRWSSVPTPSQNWTFTPLPTTAPATPTPGPGTPTAIPPTPTSYPELQRVSMNEFGYPEQDPVISSTIPISMSVTSNDNNDIYCYIADRDAGRSIKGENYVRWIKLMGGSFEEFDIGKDDYRTICRPVAVEAVGVPPTCTPTPAPTP